MNLLGGYNDGPCEAKSIQECKRDLDGELQRLNQRIENVNILHERLVHVVESDSFYNFSDNNSRKELAAMIGSTDVESRQLFHQWEKLIEEIESEEA